jgi:hypothetical protein
VELREHQSLKSAIPTEAGMSTNTEPSLERLNQLVGSWTTEATHPALPGLIVHGTAAFEWLQGERFLIQRARTDHPDFPDSVSILGFTDRDRVEGAGGAAATSREPQLNMHYFDSRGVFRVYQASVEPGSWRLWRNAPGFSQRFTGVLADGGYTVAGLWQVCEDDVHWNDDLRITYHRE